MTTLDPAPFLDDEDPLDSATEYALGWLARIALAQAAGVIPTDMAIDVVASVADALAEVSAAVAFGDLDEMPDPSPDDLAVIDAEGPLLAAELAVVEAECRALINPCPATRTAVREALTVLKRIATNRPQIGAIQ